MDPCKIITLLHKGEAVYCTDCGSPLRLVGDRHNPSYAECARGHRVYYVLDTPSHPKADRLVSLWLQPLQSLTFTHLKFIRDTFELNLPNLAKMKIKLSDGNSHLLSDSLTENMASELSKHMNILGLHTTIK